MSDADTRGRPFDGAVRDVQRLLTGFHTLLYRLSGGRLGWRVGDISMLLLSTVGRRSGRLRITPLTYYLDNGCYVLVASNGGTVGSPGWYHNLMASPHALVQVGPRVFSARAEQLSSVERARLWPPITQMYPGYLEYQKLTDREIPLVALEERHEAIGTRP